MGLIFKITFLPRFMRQLFYKPFNKLMFKSAGAAIGKNFNVYNRIYLKLYKGGNLIIGDNFTMFSGESINPISRNMKACIFVNNNASLYIGKNVGMSSRCVWCNKHIRIGDNVRLGGNVTILDTDCHSLNYLDRRHKEKDKINTCNKSIIIDEDVLIGANAIILKGVHIGARSIIAAGSIVTKDIPDDCIAGGNPCKVIHFINKDESITN